MFLNKYANFENLKFPRDNLSYLYETHWLLLNSSNHCTQSAANVSTSLNGKRSQTEPVFDDHIIHAGFDQPRSQGLLPILSAGR